MQGPIRPVNSFNNKSDENIRGKISNRRRKKSKTNKHKTWEYGIDNKHKNNKIDEEIAILRQELNLLKHDNDVTRPKSSYLSKTYVAKSINDNAKNT